MSYFWEYLVYRILSISGLSESDIINIKANFEYIYKLQCDARIDSHVASGYTYEIASRTVYAEHQCNKITDDPIYLIDNIQFHTCPCSYKHPNMSFFLQAEAAYDKGILPFEGALFDQPAYIMEAIQVIQGLRVELNMEQQKQNQDKE